MEFSPRFSSQDNVADLVHDLRQPLSNIGFGASYLSVLLGPGNDRAQEQIQAIQRQVDRLDRMLDQTAAALRRLQVQRAASSAENLDLTKPQTAAVA